MVEKRVEQKGDLLDLSSSKEFEKFSSLLDEITKKHNISAQELMALTGKKDSLPLSIFENNLSPLECVTKYLHEVEELSHKQIGAILNRSPKTVWQAYKFSLKKIPGKLEVKTSPYFIPFNLLGERKFSILESVVKHLVEDHNLKFSQIANLMNRDDRTIWTVYSRVKKKGKDES